MNGNEWISTQTDCPEAFNRVQTVRCSTTQGYELNESLVFDIKQSDKYEACLYKSSINFNWFPFSVLINLGIVY